MIKAIFFDFDGVILESAGIKIDAFRKLFERDYSEKTDAIVDYHIANMGISRFVKFRHIYKNILNLPLAGVDETALGQKFSDIVFEEIIKAPFVDGAKEFIVRNQKRYRMFIASGTPHEELREILQCRQIRHLFDDFRGSPELKPDIINGLLKRHSLRKEEAVFVGDAESDLLAAKETGVHFVARVLPDNNRAMQGCRWRISDLTNLDSVINTIATT
jgi:phosphoglycolate phosphatase-like HAD superfamily hydrolase